MFGTGKLKNRTTSWSENRPIYVKFYCKCQNEGPESPRSPGKKKTLLIFKAHTIQIVHAEAVGHSRRNADDAIF